VLTSVEGTLDGAHSSLAVSLPDRPARPPHLRRSDSSGESLKGHLDLLLLAALCGEPAHGYAIIEELERRSGGTFDLREGTIYPALHRLERQGLVESQQSEATGRRRRVYRLTRRGRRALGEKARVWRSFARGMAGALEGAR